MTYLSDWKQLLFDKIDLYINLNTIGDKGDLCAMTNSSNWLLEKQLLLWPLQ